MNKFSILMILLFMLSVSNLKSQFVINFDIPECPNSTKIFEINYNTLNIFPNPADDFIDLKFSNEIKNINNINILDVSGKIVDIIELDFCNNNNSLKKDISRLSEGIYYISINSDSKTEIFRFIKLQTP